jgi:hypothetical protein
MPQWIHNRAEHLLAKNPSMDKSQAFAIATQQSHSLGKSPKGYGTAAGRKKAKAKFDKPKKEYVKTPNPGKLDSPKMPGKPKEASALLGAFTGLMLKKANGDDDEKGRRQLTSKDKTDVAKFMMKRPKGQKDEKFHAFVEAKGMNPHGAEETVYDLLGKCAAEHKDKIPGGKADKASPKDFPKDQMSMGQKVEMEHTNDPTLSREIASDHLEEFRDYYTRLKQMEQEAEKAKEKSAASSAQTEKALRMLRVGTEKARSFAAGSKRPVKLDPRLKKVAEVDPYWFMLEELEKMAAQTAVKPLNTLDPAKQLKQTQDVGRVGAFEPKDGMKLTEYKPPSLIKKSFQVSQYSGPLSMGRFSYRNPQFQSSLPGVEKLSGPDPEAEEGDREHFPDNEKKASLWKAAHFACSAIGRWQEKNRH